MAIASFYCIIRIRDRYNSTHNQRERRINKMKKRIGIIFMLAAMMACTSCGKESQKVSQHTGNESEITAVSQKQKLVYEDVPKALAEAKHIKEHTYKYLLMDLDFEMNQPEEVGLLQLKQNNNFDIQYKRALLNYLIGGKVKENCLKREPRQSGWEYKDGLVELVVGNEGYVYYTREGDKWIRLFNKDEYESITYRDISLNQPYEDEVLTWNGKSFRISEMLEVSKEKAIAYAEKFDTMSWVPTAVKVMQEKDGQYYFMVYYSKASKEMTYFNGYDAMFQDYMEEPYTSLEQSYTIIDSNKQLVLLTNQNGVIQYEGEKEGYDKILTLDCASKLLSDKLSKDRRYEVCDINLEYMLVRPDAEKNISQEGDAVQTGMYWLRDMKAGNHYEARPIWRYYLKDGIGTETFAFVDARTGKVEYAKVD